MKFITTLSAYLPVNDSRSTSQIEKEILDELDFHISMRMEENMRQGMSYDAAREAALAQFGDFGVIQRKCRHAVIGARIMWQRVQLALSVILLVAVILLALQLYSSQNANQTAIERVTSALSQLAPAARAAGEKPESQAAPAAPPKSYPVELKADTVREFATLAVNFGKLKLSGQAITVVPILTEVGVTGAIVLGKGTYSYEPAAGKEFTGHFRAVVLRFNPKDTDAILKLSDGQLVTDKGAFELARNVFNAVLKHCYHAGNQALIPAEKAIAADVFSQELGEVLMSGDDTTTIVYDFNAKKQLYPE